MKKYFYIYITIFICIAFNVFGQDNGVDSRNNTSFGCGYTEDPNIRSYTNDLIKGMYSNAKKSRTLDSRAVLKIPVVVHVIEPISGTTLISDAQVTDVIANLNHAYRASDYNTGSYDTEIEFELAKWDPNNQPTNGIARYDASNDADYVTNGVFNAGVSWSKVQSWSGWSKRLYLNIWLVNRLGNGAAGVGSPSEGFIATASQVGGSHDYVSAHEVGHFLGLMHPFPNPGSDCNCGDGDGLVDTPNLMSYGIWSSCLRESACSEEAQGAINPCTNSPLGAIQLNIMNYVNGGCDRVFTTDQSTLMRAMLQTYHATLLTSPVLDIIAPTPTANILGDNTFCTSSTNFPDLSPVCIGGSISEITRNGNIISESDLTVKPILSPGESMTWQLELSCTSGSIATKSVTFYSPGVSNVKTTCTLPGSYSVTFDNVSNYSIATSQGLVMGNSVINIPNSSNANLNVTDANGCGNNMNVEIPCCAQSLVALSQCTPTFNNGSGYYFGVANFNFGSINKSSFLLEENEENYIDEACSEQTTVNSSESYAISVTAFTTNPNYIKVYIDYNNDGYFTGTTPNELVFSGRTPGGASNTLSGMVTIPSDATNDVRLRMRVMADWVATSNSCVVEGLAGGYGSGRVVDYSVSITSPSSDINPLPVHLISFEAKAEKNANLLSWSSATETANIGYEVQASEDGVHFEKIGFVDGKHNYVGKSEYQFLDQNLKPSSIYYYRLKQMDLDGGFEVSRIISLKSYQDDFSPYVFPNPVNTNQFSLTLPDINSYSISMFSLDGVEKHVNVKQTASERELIITGKEKLASGLYILKMTSKNGTVDKSVKLTVE